MAFVWTVLAVLFCIGTIEGQTQRASNCFGTPGCDHMELICPNSRRIFILKIQYGSKVANTSCSGSGPCQPFCCRREASDRVWNYGDFNFGLVYTSHGCWNFTSCSSQVARANTPYPGYTPLSSYAETEYSCLGDGDITDFHRSTTVTAPVVAVHYDASDVIKYPVVTGDSQTWHCQVDTADCVPRLADVILVKENYTAGNSSGCSSVGWSGGPFLSCVEGFRYLSLIPLTPFRVSVRVDNAERNPSGWAVVRVQDGANLVVTCGLTDGQLPVSSACSTSSTADQTSSTSQTVTSRGTASPSSATSADVTDSMTTTLASAKPPSMNCESSASGGGLIGALVTGWVLVGLLTASYFFIGVRLHRRGHLSDLMQHLACR